ncbi:rab-GTPase-TBC domain-containing protein [Phthorimaea operculella]|nr:rab-GTPase-TBC domain-containing protein [Phthorimaea operculella]
MLTEVNIKHEELSSYSIEGYDMYTNTRESSKGGGVIIYAKSTLNFTATPWQGHACEIIKGTLKTSNKEIHIIAVYRPPKTNKNCFIQEIDSLIKSIPSKHDLVLLGDTNININDMSKSSAIEYTNTLCAYGLECAITEITREEVLDGRLVASCIDHVWVRRARACTARAPAAAHMLTCKLSDHYMVGLSIAVKDDDCATPFCYLYDDPVQLYYTFRAFYIRYWHRLHFISTHPQGIVSLCLLYERLLEANEPLLWIHFRNINVNPVRVVFKWIMRAFSGHLPPDQLLLLWDAILGYDCLEILPLLAVAILSFRKENIFQVNTLQNVDAVLADLSTISVIPLLQLALMKA